MLEEMSQESNNDEMQERGEAGAAAGGMAGGYAGGYAGAAVGAYFGGPMGAAIGQYVGQKVGEKIGAKIGDKLEDKLKEQAQDNNNNNDEDDSNNNKKKKDGGGCSGGTSRVEEYKCSDGQCHATPETPKFKLEIEQNDVPENWWDNLPDIDPRVYDAISMEQAAACVKYIFDGLPDMHELENSMEARGFRKICPRLKTKVPRTKIIRPKEIIYDTRISDFIKKD